MAPVWIDAKGEEHELLIAEKSLTITDPAFGFDRQIIAGQPVPPELQDAYEKTLSRSASRSSSSSSGSGSSGASSSEQSNASGQKSRPSRSRRKPAAKSAGK